MATIPNIGFNNARVYVEYHVMPAYRDFDQTPTRSNAVKFAEAAWHVHDRLWHDRGKPNRLADFAADMIKACPELRLIRDLADAGKHHELDRGSVTLAGLDGSEGGGVLESFSPLGMTSSVDRGSLKIKEHDGSEHDPLVVFRRVVEFWRSEATK
jgi:hypothetical protein